MDHHPIEILKYPTPREPNDADVWERLAQILAAPTTELIAEGKGIVLRVFVCVAPEHRAGFEAALEYWIRTKLMDPYKKAGPAVAVSDRPPYGMFWTRGSLLYENVFPLGTARSEKDNYVFAASGAHSRVRIA